MQFNILFGIVIICPFLWQLHALVVFQGLTLKEKTNTLWVKPVELFGAERTIIPVVFTIEESSENSWYNISMHLYIRNDIKQAMLIEIQQIKNILHMHAMTETVVLLWCLCNLYALFQVDSYSLLAQNLPEQ